jgi:hypothetical protein
MVSDAETQRSFIRQRVNVGDANTLTSSTETTDNELTDQNPVVVGSVGMSLALGVLFVMVIYFGFTFIIASE